jgi:hypothetical protein
VAKQCRSAFVELSHITQTPNDAKEHDAFYRYRIEQPALPIATTITTITAPTWMYIDIG